jgi:hypothetical protein
MFKRFILALITVLFISINSYADDVGSGNIHNATPPLAFATSDGVKIRPRVVITDRNGFVDNHDGTINLTPASSDSVANNYYKLDGSNANSYLYLDTNKYLKKIDSSTVGIYVNNVLVHTWIAIAAVPPSGSYMGFGCLIY